MLTIWHQISVALSGAVLFIADVAVVKEEVVEIAYLPCHILLLKLQQGLLTYFKDDACMIIDHSSAVL